MADPFFRGTNPNKIGSWADLEEETRTDTQAIGFFTFEAKDVQVLGEVIFEEEVQRSSSDRFYTLDEQISDSYEKLMPRDRRVKKFDRQKLETEVARYRDLYTTYIQETPESYVLQEPAIRRTFDWIFPVYPSDDRTKYDWAAWSSLFAPASIRLANAYPRMVAALPMPYATMNVGTPYPVDKVLESYDKEGKASIRLLPTFQTTRTKRREDDTMTLVPTPVEGTGDTLRHVGYYLKKRPFEIPEPQADHVFFKDAEARYVESEAPLNEFVPQLDAIMMNGVKTTNDPYVEGAKYLKLYDVSLSSIPWSLWKKRFPPVPVTNDVPAVEELPFPEPPQNAPSKKLTEQYGVPYFPGKSARLWLQEREDGGSLVALMKLSQASDSGVVPVSSSEMGELVLQPADLTQCSLDVPFQQFQIQGILRKMSNGVVCVPMEIIDRERHQLGYKGKKVWEDATANRILMPRINALAAVRPPPPSMKAPMLSKMGAQPTSQQRARVLAVLNDETRLPEDKEADVQLLLRESIHSKEQYTDKEGLFVLCDHTVAILQGDLAKDRIGFYRTWTYTEDGFRVCRVCGEQIGNDVYVDQDEYNEDGRLVRHTEALGQTVVGRAEVADYTRDLRSMLPMFVMTDPSDATAYLVLSLLQVLPDPNQVAPIIQFARTMSTAFAKTDTLATRRARGVTGITAAAAILQTHLPALTPRRSFGSRPLMLDGYPRDTASSEGFTIADSLVLAIRKTFSAFPTAIQGPSADVIRAINNESKTIRNQIIGFMPRFVKQFQTQFEKAKAEFASRPPTPEPVNLIPNRLPPAQMGTITRFAQCSAFRLTWISKILPLISQPIVPLRPGLSSSPLARKVKSYPSVRAVPATLPTAEISRRLKIAIPARMGIEPTESWKVNSLLISKLSSIAQLPTPIASLDPTASSDLLRDITKGYLREVLAAIGNDPEKRRIFDRMRTEDVTLYSLLASVSSARTETNTLRAKERHAFTDRLRAMTDSDREITKQLLDRGLAPFIVTVSDRDMFAQQLQSEIGSSVDHGEEYEPEGPADPAAEAYDLAGDDTIIEDDNVPPIGNREED
jgi:hypothetical protein